MLTVVFTKPSIIHCFQAFGECDTSCCNVLSQFRQEIFLSVTLDESIYLRYAVTATTIIYIGRKAVYLLLNTLQRTNLFVVPQNNFISRYSVIAILLDSNIVDEYATINV